MKKSVFKTLSILSLAAVFSAPTLASAQPVKKKKGPDPAVVAAKRPLSILEDIGGWKSLFDGKSLAGWTGATEKYTAKDGVLSCTEGARQIFTDKEYSDFALRFQFKLTPGGNSGIGLRVPGEGSSAAYDGMEIQILDHDHEKYAKLKPWQKHGSIYTLMPAKTGYLKPLGEWNEETIICIEDHVIVILNGAVILDAWLDKLSPLAGHAHPGLRNRSGYITIAGHNDPIEFRELAVMDLAPSAPVLKGGGDNVAPAGFRAFFNGKNLKGWKGLAHKKAPERRALKGKALAEAQAVADENMRAHWSVVDGVLTYDGEGMSLCTAKDYGDFEFYVDWKIPPGADSGIYLRGTPQVQIWDPWDARSKDGSVPETPEDWVLAYKTGRNLGSGGLWNNKKHRNSPLVLADKKPGEWNTFLIRMVGEKVSIWLNGKLIVDRTVMEGFWDKTGQTPVARMDQIELQHHGSALYFKNLYIRELPF